jgi:hypothetical protein
MRACAASVFPKTEQVAKGHAFVDRGISDPSAGSREPVAVTAMRRLAAILAADVAGYSRLMGGTRRAPSIA